MFTKNAGGSSFFVFMNQKRKDDLIEEKKQTESLERCMHSDHSRSCHHRVHSWHMAVLAADRGIRSLEHLCIFSSPAALYLGTARPEGSQSASAAL